MPIPKDICRGILDNQGIDKNRPLVVQVSRFDPWKDPFGVIKAYQLAKEKIPGLQLALVGSLAGDDPEGWQIYAAIHDEANKDPDIFVFSNLTGVGNMEVNAFQTAADIVLQKSIKEGFGLVITEALWKGKPVIAGNVGGIPLQIRDGDTGYFYETPYKTTRKVIYLLENARAAKMSGERGRAYVEQHFLLPDRIADYLMAIDMTMNRIGINKIRSDCIMSFHPWFKLGKRRFAEG